VKHALKYGENPHQQASITLDENPADPLALGRFTLPDGRPVSAQLGEMSWIMLKDFTAGIDAITRIAAAYDLNTGRVPKIAVLVNHGSACGAAAGDTDQVINQAIHGNYRAALGSFLVINFPMTEPTAYKARQWMVETRPFAGVAAPSVDDLGAKYFQRKKRVCHVLANPALAKLDRTTLDTQPMTHTIRGAAITQTPNHYLPAFPKEWDKSLVFDMCLAWGVAATGASNCITLAKDGVLIGNAVGQGDRMAACELAVHQAITANRQHMLDGASAVSESFFAFADGLDYLARRKVRAIFATHGSMHDQQIREHAATFDGLIFHTVPDREARTFAGH
jgi:phosphoribosylaminoimidazolecarboxamide formyltransferase/IMP cyclohydrolase